MRSSLLPVAALAAASTVLAADAFNIRPGLWNTTTTTQYSGAPLYVEGMPESSRGDYAKQWASMVNKPMVHRDPTDCISEKDIRDSGRMIEEFKKDRGSCTHSISRQTSSQMVAVVECKDGKVTTRTEIDYVASSPTAFRGTMKTTINSPNGTTRMDMTLEGKWVAASCPAGSDDDDDEDYEDDE